MFHLLVTPFRVLFAWVEVQAGSAGDVVACKDLFTCGVLVRYVFQSVFFQTVLLTPRERALEADAGLMDIPFCSAKVAEKAFSGQPHTVRVSEGVIGRVGRGGGFGRP